MKAEFLNPFVIATKTTFSSMLATEIQVEKLRLKTHNTADTDVTAVIGMSGKLRGSIVLAFTMETAKSAVGKFLGMGGDDLNMSDVCDGIGELCNIIGGSAKVELNKIGLNMAISIPNVILGKGLTIVNNPAYPTLVVPFSSSLGNFQVEVCLMEA